MLNGFPTFAIVQLHPVILAILHLARILQSLGEEFPEIVVVRSVLEAEIADIAQILVELLCDA